VYDEDWDSEEPGYPRAPLPPHERTWRHPSELGFVAQQQFAPRPPRLPRLILVGVGAVGVAAAAGLVMLLAPRSGGSGIQTSSRALPVEAGDVVGFDSMDATATTAKRRPSATSMPRTRKPVAPAQVQARRSLSTMLLSGVERVAVAVGDGRHALTTANSLEVDQLVDVVVGEGATVVGRVLSVSNEQNIAVLELDRVMSSVARKVAYTTPQNGDRVTVGQDAAEATVRVSEGLLRVETELVAQDGEPVVDAAGRLVGLVSRSADGSLHLVTIPRLAALKATVLVIDVWLGLRFEPDSLQVVEATADAPATLAGIQPGDALTAIGDSRLTCIDDLWVELAFMKAGQTVSVEFLRDGVAQSAEVTLAARPS
jgi:hypothetical protein